MDADSEPSPLSDGVSKGSRDGDAKPTPPLPPGWCGERIRCRTVGEVDEERSREAADIPMEAVPGVPAALLSTGSASSIDETKLPRRDRVAGVAAALSELPPPPPAADADEPAAGAVDPPRLSERMKPIALTGACIGDCRTDAGWANSPPPPPAALPAWLLLGAADECATGNC